MKHKIAFNILSLPVMETIEKILFAPLNWGLGHAARIVPLVQNEIDKGNLVYFTATGLAKGFLKKEFPNAQFIEAPEFKIRYAQKPFFTTVLFLQMPLFFISFFRDWYYLRSIIKLHGITKVIADNRYGFHNKNIKSILVTHQLFIKLPGVLKILEPFLHFVTRLLINRFNECWVPDYKEIRGSLCGTLAHGKNVPDNVKYIDPISRFSNFVLNNGENKYDVVALISGPEPQRSIFEENLTERFKESRSRVLFICGKPNNNELEHIGNITKVPHMSSTKIANYINNTKKVIARSGYSTIMDLHVLNVEAELIPTPGQTEQEYLAEWSKKSRLD